MAVGVCESQQGQLSSPMSWTVPRLSAGPGGVGWNGLVFLPGYFGASLAVTADTLCAPAAQRVPPDTVSAPVTGGLAWEPLRAGRSFSLKDLTCSLGADLTRRQGTMGK